MSCTDERVESLKQEWAAGKSAGVIAIGLGTSRNAVIGKIHRLRLDGRETTQRKLRKGHDPHNAPKYVSRKKETSAAPSKLAPRSRRAPWAVPYMHKHRGLACDLKPEVVAEPVSFMALEKHHCRFPVSGERASTMFCGATKEPGYPYCSHHCRIAYNGHATRLSRAEFEIKGRELARRGKAA